MGTNVVSGSLVVISDLHLDHVTQGISRLPEVEAAVLQSVAHAVAIKASAWLFLGDAMDPDAGAKVFDCLRVLFHAAEALRQAGIPVVMLAGNHDVVVDGSEATTLTPFRHSAGVHLLERPSVLELPDLPPMAAFPFAASSHSYDPETAFDALDGYVTLSHLNVAGVQPGEETKEIPRGREVMFPITKTTKALLRLQGHYHRQQAFDPGDDGPPILIPGAPCRLTHSEEGHEPGYLVVGVP